MRAWTTWRKVKVKHLIAVFSAFSYLPVRAASLLGLQLTGFGFAYAALVVELRLLGELVTVLVKAGAELVVAGLAGEYVWRILEEARPRSPFMVARAFNAPPR